MEHLTTIVGILGFIVLWLALSFFISKVSGWQELAKDYESTNGFMGKKLNMRTGVLGNSNLRSTLIIGLDRSGLFLGVCSPFSFGSKDLLIPLEKIEYSVEKQLFGKVIISFDGHSKIKLKISRSLAKKLNKVSGLCFFNVV